MASVASWAQLKVEIKEETKSMSKGSFNALVMELPGTNDKDVNNALKKFMKQYKGKVKYDKKINEHIADNSTIKDMSDTTVDIYAKVEPKGDAGTALSVWFNLGASYLSSKDYADRYPAAEQFMKAFANEVSADMIKEELKVQEKLLKDKETELKKLEKDKDGYEKAIADAKATIQKMEEQIDKGETDIKQNDEDQVNKKTEIEEQKKVVEDVKQRLESVKK